MVKGAGTVGKSARVINLMQYEYNPRTGKDLHFNEQNIIDALQHRTIKRWAYIRHDKDVYSEDDELDNIEFLGKEYDRKKKSGEDVGCLTREDYVIQNQWVKQGELKPPHWHVVAQCDRATDLAVYARWFGVLEQYIEAPSGRGNFLDCTEYLTHESPKQQAKGKHRYEDELVKSNFNFRSELDRRALTRAKYGGDVDRKTELRLMVLNGEITLREIRKNYPLNYIEDRDKLQQMRLEYISEAQPPRMRHNFYICGSGGVGKGVASDVLAHVLYPDIEDDDDLLFRVGAEGANFDGYDGQPVIIWDDCRASDLLKKLKGRGNVFNVFDTSPHKQKQNIKFGAVNLINAVNIVNSVQPYKEFLNGLVGEYKDSSGVKHEAEENEKNQSYRRFPYIIPLREEDFDILINQGYILKDSQQYREYFRFSNISGNFGKLIATFPKGSMDIVRIGSKMLQPAIGVISTLQEEADKKAKEKIVDMSEVENFGIAETDENATATFQSIKVLIQGEENDIIRLSLVEKKKKYDELQQKPMCKWTKEEWNIFNEIYNFFCSEEIAVGRTPFGCVKSALQNGFDVDEVAKELMVSTEYVQEVKDYLDYESLKG